MYICIVKLYSVHTHSVYAIEGSSESYFRQYGQMKQQRWEEEEKRRGERR